MRLLLDENVDDAVGDVFAEYGHEVIRARDVLLTQTPDTVIGTAAGAAGLIVVTHDRDFGGIIKQIPKGLRSRVREQSGRITLNCGAHSHITRLHQTMRKIEDAYRDMKDEGKRLIMTITESGYNVTDQFLPDK